MILMILFTWKKIYIHGIDYATSFQLSDRRRQSVPATLHGRRQRLPARVYFPSDILPRASWGQGQVGSQQSLSWHLTLSLSLALYLFSSELHDGLMQSCHTSHTDPGHHADPATWSLTWHPKRLAWRWWHTSHLMKCTRINWFMTPFMWAAVWCWA